ncbi:Cytochrome P450 3A11 [Trichoplax sp. H2]|nr:Cytochrome P450 3A11 [Trichoplax sp. H2]|eukprot:RDD37240.1 Cytochrome P450 3A11 [Trichoplax sp. H2]
MSGYLQSFCQLFCSIILILSLRFIYKNYLLPYWRIKRLGIPVAPPKPIIGNNFDYGSGNQHLAQLKRQEKYGSICGTLFYHIPTIWVGDPEILKVITVSDFSTFPNRYDLNEPRPPFDKAIIQLKNQDWKRVRNILIPTFSASKLKSLMPILNDAGNDLTVTLSKADQEGRPIDIWRTCGVFTMKVTLATVFGLEMDSKEQEKKMTEAASMFFRDITGVVQFLFIYLMPLVGLIEPLLGGKIIESVRYLLKTVENVIQERRENIKAGIPCRKDILQQMIEAGDDDKLNDAEILAQAITFLVAGYDTTANTLGFTCYLLATHPEIQKKLRDEIDAKCPDLDSIEYDTLHDLPYMDMIISETLRLYPTAFFLNRDIKKDTTINGVHFTKDLMIGIPVYAIHHNPKIWSNPEEFIPERFSPKEKAKHAPCSFLPFGNGPRNCVGMRLALLEAKLALVKIMQKFEMRAVPETEIPLTLRSGNTISPINGVIVGVSRRR